MDTSQPSVEESIDVTVERGLEALAAGDVEGALRLCLAARDRAPTAPEYLYLMGLISIRVNRQTDAIDCMLEGHRHAPNCREFSSALAALYAAHGKLADSLYHSKLTHAQTPHPLLSRFEPHALGDADSALSRAGLAKYFQSAFIAFMAGDLLRAKTHCEDELRVNPDSAAAHALYGRVLLGLGLYREAVIAFSLALDCQDDDPLVPALLSEAMVGAGDIERGIAVGAEAVRLAPGNAEVLARLIRAWERLPAQGQPARDALIKEWCALSDSEPASPLPALPRSGGQRPRIGLMINDYAATRLLEPIETILRHRCGLVEYHAYQLFMNQPQALNRLGTHTDVWRELVDVDDETAAAIIRGAGTDILIDLCGISSGARPAILRARPAPVQLSWLNEGVALPGIDHILTDPVSRRGLAADLSVLELPYGPFCQTRSAIMSAQSLGVAAPARSNRFVTFGATLDLPRILPSIEVWARLLTLDPTFRLILGNVAFISAGTLAPLQEVFDAHGVSDRVLIDTPEPGPGEEPSFWSKADIILSPLEAPDMFETAHVLALGLPMVGLNGPRLSQARTAGLFEMAGQSHWVADDVEQYLRIAASMGQSPDVAAQLRDDLSRTIPTMALCDTASFVRIFESVLAEVAHRAA